MAEARRKMTWPRFLVEACLVALSALLGGVVSSAIQIWGIENLDWFAEPCDDIRMAACLAPQATTAWTALGAATGIGIWLIVRSRVGRRANALG